MAAETNDRESNREDRYDDLGPLLDQLAGLSESDTRRDGLREQIIARCLPLADHIARKFGGRGEPFDDLAQVARIGLVHAVDRFDATRGSPFLSFAVPTIMGEVRRHFRDNTWAMRVPRRVKEIHLRIGPTVDALSQRLGRSPTAKEIATALDVEPEDVAQALIASHAYQPASIDAVSSGSSTDNTLLDTLGDSEPRYDRVEEYLAIQPLISDLPERERQVLILRFFESQTQTQIAQRLGISQMHVSRILSKTLTHLRKQALED